MPTPILKLYPLRIQTFYQWWDLTVERWPHATFRTTEQWGEATHNGNIVAYFKRDLHQFEGYVCRGWNE